MCCGAFTARYDGRDVAFTRSRKARELLAFLATRHGMTASCDEAIAALWPDAEPDRARRLLINAAWRIRCGFRDNGMGEADVAASVLRFDHDRYTLDGRLCSCDLARFRAEHARGETYLRPYGVGADDARQMLAEAQRLLDLDTLIESPVLAGETYSWLPALERQIRELRLSSLRRALRLASRGAAHELTLSIAERILTLDALDEPTVALTCASTSHAVILLPPRPPTAPSGWRWRAAMGPSRRLWRSPARNSRRSSRKPSGRTARRASPRLQRLRPLHPHRRKGHHHRERISSNASLLSRLEGTPS